jgi:acyl-CoA thioesterase-1
MRTKLQFISRRTALIRFVGATFLLVPGFLLADESTNQAVRVACVGDSITYGAGIKDRKNDSYPACLGRWLGGGYDVRNFGRSGATLLANGDLPYIKQQQYRDALAFKPDVAVIILGTNDSKHHAVGEPETNNFADNWKYKADYVPNYVNLIGALRDANPAVKIWICSPPPSFPGQWGINDETIRDEITPRVYQVAAQTDVKVINLYSALSGRGELFPDTVHPNAAGAKVMAGVVYTSVFGKSAPM